MADAMYLEEKGLGTGEEQNLGQKALWTGAVLALVILGGLYFFYGSSYKSGSNGDDLEKPQIVGAVLEWNVLENEGRDSIVGKIETDKGIVVDVAYRFLKDGSSKAQLGYYDERFKEESRRTIEEGSLRDVLSGDYVEVYTTGEDRRDIVRINYLR